MSTQPEVPGSVFCSFIYFYGEINGEGSHNIKWMQIHWFVEVKIKTVIIFTNYRSVKMPLERLQQHVESF